MLTWRQRTAIAAPILLLASVATVALSGGDDEDPATASPKGEVHGLTVAATTPASDRGAPEGGSSDPANPSDGADSNEPDDAEGADDRGGQDDRDRSNSEPDVIAPERGVDDDTTRPDDPTPGPDRHKQVDPDTDDGDGEADRGGTDGTDDRQDRDESDDSDESDDESEGGDNDSPSPDPAESDEPDGRSETIQRRCEAALDNVVNNPGVSDITDCVNAVLHGTPLPQVLRGLRDASQSDVARPCVLGILLCRD